MTADNCTNFADDASVQFWRLVDIEMINGMIGAHVDIIERTAEAGSRPHLSVIPLSKIDNPSYVPRGRKRLGTVKRHHERDWNSFVA